MLTFCLPINSTTILCKLFVTIVKKIFKQYIHIIVGWKKKQQQISDVQARVYNKEGGRVSYYT